MYSTQNSLKISFKTNGHSQYNGGLFSYVTSKLTYPSFLQEAISFDLFCWILSWITICLLIFKSVSENCTSYCENGGTCEFLLLDGLRCNCSGTGHIGTKCERKIFDLLQFTSNDIITNNDCLFGCPIIYIDIYSQCYFVHWHLQQCLIKSSSLANRDAIFVDNY